MPYYHCEYKYDDDGILDSFSISFSYNYAISTTTGGINKTSQSQLSLPKELFQGFKAVGTYNMSVTNDGTITSAQTISFTCGSFSKSVTKSSASGSFETSDFTTNGVGYNFNASNTTSWLNHRLSVNITFTRIRD